MNRAIRLFGSRFAIIIAAFILIAACGRLHAQQIDPRITGSTYVFAFPDTLRNPYDPWQETDTTFRKREPQQDSVFITIYSPTGNAITITGYGGYSVSATMNAGEFKTIWLNGTPRAAAPICDEVGIISNKTFRLEATSPVVAYCFMATKFGTEAFTPLAVADWGRKYYAAALPSEQLPYYDVQYDSQGNVGGAEIRYEAAPSEILVIAAYDSTAVTIRANAQLNGSYATSVMLMKDQCYQVQSVNNRDLNAQASDLGGSAITANKPIGVISGNTRALNADAATRLLGQYLLENTFQNLMIEWLTPTEQHGTEFVYLPTMDAWHPIGIPGTDTISKRRFEAVRIYGTSGSLNDAGTNGTEIDGKSGQVSQLFNVKPTKFFESLIPSPIPQLFRTDRPAQAYMTSSGAEALAELIGTPGMYTAAIDTVTAPYMVGMTPREQWSYAVPYTAPSHPAQMTHYLDIVTDSSSRNRITINGQPLLIDKAIDGTDLYWGTRALHSGETGIIQGADSTCKFYAVIYGGMTGSKGWRDIGFAQIHYEENIGFMYGYPVASAHTVLNVDSLQTSAVTTSENVAGYTFNSVEPNPFTTSTKIGFTLGAGGATTVEIYDRTGARIATLIDGMLDAGRHAISWNTVGIPSGVYYCRIQSGRWSTARPLFLVR